jgi:hypothetical protein
MNSRKLPNFNRFRLAPAEPGGQACLAAATRSELNATFAPSHLCVFALKVFCPQTAFRHDSGSAIAIEILDGKWDIPAAL